MEPIETIQNNQQTNCVMPGVTNTMAALSVILAILCVIYMPKLTNKSGFGWGVLFFMTGSALGSATGRLIEKPKNC